MDGQSCTFHVQEIAASHFSGMRPTCRHRRATLFADDVPLAASKDHEATRIDVEQLRRLFAREEHFPCRIPPVRSQHLREKIRNFQTA